MSEQAPLERRNVVDGVLSTFDFSKMDVRILEGISTIFWNREKRILFKKGIFEDCITFINMVYTKSNTLQSNMNQSNENNIGLEGSLQRRLAVKFPEKLMNALDCGTYSDCIRWTTDGLSFEILDPGGVEKKFLKELFNGTKLHSFIRKIYKWGFVTRTSIKSPAWKIFSHVAFRKGQRQLCRQMKRDKKIEEYSQLCASFGSMTMENQSFSISYTPHCSNTTTRLNPQIKLHQQHHQHHNQNGTSFRMTMGDYVLDHNHEDHHEVSSSPYPLCTTKHQPVDFDERYATELLRALQEE